MDGMLIPRFTLRRLFLVTTLCAVFFLVLSFALRGYVWAAAISAAGLAVVVSFTLYAALFALTWLVSRGIAWAAGRRERNSRFGEHELPPRSAPKEIE
jgi:hypothetical protein